MQHKALPNLLVNPEFGVNQRGKESYTASSTQYTYDRWLAAYATVTREANTSPAPVLYMAKCVFQNTNWPNFGQTLENYSQYVGKTLTVRFWIKGLPRTSSVTLWVGNSGHVIPLTGCLLYTSAFRTPGIKEKIPVKPLVKAFAGMKNIFVPCGVDVYKRQQIDITRT